MVQLSQGVVNGIDWAVVGLAGLLVLVSLLGAVFAFRVSASKRRPAAHEFNTLWRLRSFTEVFAAAYALSLLLRLQVLWGPASVFKAGGYHPTTFCRVYIGATYGIFEPAFLLLALFACLYSLKGKDSASSPNFSIVLFSAGFSLPSCAAQLVAALFTRIFELDYAGSSTLAMMFNTHDTSLTQHCEGAASPSDCAFCLFPLLSTFISAAFCALYLAALWVVTLRILRTVINKALARRVRMLQVLTTVWVVVSLACRSCTVLFEPFELGFEALRLAHVLAEVCLVLTLQFFLVLKPVWDTHAADRILKQLASEKASTLPQPLLPACQQELGLQPLGYERDSGGGGRQAHSDEGDRDGV